MLTFLRGIEDVVTNAVKKERKRNSASSLVHSSPKVLGLGEDYVIQ